MKGTPSLISFPSYRKDWCSSALRWARGRRNKLLPFSSRTSNTCSTTFTWHIHTIHTCTHIQTNRHPTEFSNVLLATDGHTIQQGQDQGQVYRCTHNLQIPFGSPPRPPPLSASWCSRSGKATDNLSPGHRPPPPRPGHSWSRRPSWLDYSVQSKHAITKHAVYDAVAAPSTSQVEEGRGGADRYKN